METKRYALFVGDTFRPAGGWRDFAGLFDSRAEAVAAKNEPKDHAGWWWHVADMLTGKIVAGQWDVDHCRWLARRARQRRELGPNKEPRPKKTTGYSRYSSGASCLTNSGPTPNLDEFLKDFEP